jgi:hypothetical protein
MSRLWSKSEKGTRYEPKKPAIVNETMALKTVALPTLMRLNKHVIAPVIPILTSGTFILVFTLPIADAFGTARSRAKAQSWRDAVATMVRDAQQNMSTRQAERAVPPATEREACVRISMKGKPVGVERAALMSPMQ